MRVAAVILLVAFGCSLVMSRPSEEIEQDEPVVRARGAISSSVVHVGRNINGVWNGIKDKVHQIEENIFKPVVDGAIQSADGAADIFTNKVHGFTTALIKPAVVIANGVVIDAWDGVSDKINDIKVSVIKPLQDGVDQAKDGALYIFQDTVHGLTTGVFIPAVNAAHGAALSAEEVAKDIAIVLNSGFTQGGVDLLYIGANNALVSFDKFLSGLTADHAAAHTNDSVNNSQTVEETVNDI